MKGQPEAIAATADASEVDEDSDLKNPAKPTAGATRLLIASTPQPTAAKIYGCIEQVTQIMQESGNEQDMIAAKAKVMSLASADTELYHFCFYQLMVRLDDRLAVGGPLMTEVATNFIDGMKALWILAGGLDALTDQQHYFDYLRARYVQISKDVFGRDVVVVGPPMGGVIDPAFMTKAMAKPAGPAPTP